MELSHAAPRGLFHAGFAEAIDQFGRQGTVDAPGLQVSTEALQRPDGLTRREIDVLTKLASGLANKQIASELDISVATIERHLVNVYRKIGARGRADATTYVMRQQWVDPRRPEPAAPTGFP